MSALRSATFCDGSGFVVGRGFEFWYMADGSTRMFETLHGVRVAEDSPWFGRIAERLLPVPVESPQ